MFKTLRNAWSIPDLRKKMLYTLLMIFVFRLGSHIPVPGLRPEEFETFVNGSSLFGLMDAFSGGAFSQATVFAMGITPYINASIILQLLTVAIPALERLSKEGEEGQKKIASWTRIITVVLGFIQATGLYFGIKPAVINPSWTSYVTIVATFTAGTAFLMWLGEQITDKGVGNGISIIIFAGIVASLPTMGHTLYQAVKMGSEPWWTVALVILFNLAMIAFVVFITDAERRITVQYAKRMVGRKMYGGQSTHIPLKVTMAGVIPIIFAMSILSFPQTIMQFTGGAPTTGFWGTFWSFFTPQSWVYIVLYLLLIIFFTYFYTAIQFNPIEVANNMKKNGGFIPGIRPGSPTSAYLSKILSRITLSGAFFLGIVAIIPLVIAKYNATFSSVSITGTSLLIMVGVALETVKQIESQMMMRHYKGFLD